MKFVLLSLLLMLVLTSLRRTQSCLTSAQLKEFIDEEYGWYLANK